MSFWPSLTQKRQAWPGHTMTRGRAAAAVTNSRACAIQPSPAPQPEGQPGLQYRWRCVQGCKSRRTWARPGAAQLGGDEHTLHKGTTHATHPEPVEVA